MINRPITFCVFGTIGRTIAGCTEGQYFDWNSTKYILSFDDSYTFVQGTLGYPGFRTIGNALPGQFAFTPEEVFTNQIVQNFTGTAEGGPNWIEFITSCAVEDGFYYPKDCSVQLWDFAFGGATVSTEYVPPRRNITTELVNQTDQYRAYGHRYLGAKWEKILALVTVWIGVNDLNFLAVYNQSQRLNMSFPEFYNTIISTEFSVVQRLADVGFRNFLFMNLPPLDRTPANVALTSPLPNRTLIGWWYSMLARHAAEFEDRNKEKGAKAMVYDANTFLNSILDHPAAYNITNTTQFCPSWANITFLTDPASLGCEPYSEYFWYNTVHV